MTSSKKSFLEKKLKYVSQILVFSIFFNLEKGLLEICEGVLQSIFNGKIQGENDFSLATKQLLGMGYHAAGSQMMHVIDQAEGVEVIMKILEDPRLFFIKYNEAAKSLMAKPGSHSYYLFKKELVTAVKNLGQKFSFFKPSKALAE
jgi:hypothetical protein